MVAAAPSPRLLRALLPLIAAGCSLAPNTPNGRMVASYYGRPFDGRLTANGEVYDRRRMTAAHKTIPFGTLLRVTNPKNGRSVVVRVNDRGPFVSGRDLDLSEGAARSLGVLADGVSDVTVEELSEANEVLTGDYVVPVRRP